VLAAPAPGAAGVVLGEDPIRGHLAGGRGMVCAVLAEQPRSWIAVGTNRAGWVSRCGPELKTSSSLLFARDSLAAQSRAPTEVVERLQRERIRLQSLVVSGLLDRFPSGENSTRP